MAFNLSNVTLNTTANNSFLNRTSVNPGTLFSTQSDTKLHNLVSCPGAIPAQVMTLLKTVPKEHVKIQNNSIIVYRRDRQKVAISPLRFKSGTRGTIVELTLTKDLKLDNQNEYCLIQNQHFVAVNKNKCYFWNLAGGKKSLNRLPDVVEVAGPEHFINASSYQNYAYLFSQTGRLFRVDPIEKRYEEVVTTNSELNKSVVSRVSSFLFSSTSSLHYDPTVDLFVNLHFIDEFCFVATRTKVIKINLESGKREVANLPGRTPHIEIVQTTVLDNKIFCLITESATSSPSYLVALDIDFTLPEVFVTAEQKLTRNLRSKLDLRSSEIKLIPSKSHDDSTKHEVVAFGGDKIYIIDVELNGSSWQEKFDFLSTVEAPEFLVDACPDIEHPENILFYANSLGILKLQQYREVHQNLNATSTTSFALPSTTFLGASFFEQPNMNQDLTKIERDGSNTEKIKAAFFQFCKDRHAKSRQMLKNLDFNESLDSTVYDIGNGLLDNNITPSSSQICLNILKEKCTVMEKFQKFTNENLSINPNTKLKILMLNATATVSYMTYVFLTKKSDEETQNAVQTILSDRGATNADQFFKNPGNISELVELLNKNFDNEKVLQVMGMIAQAYLNFREKKSSVYTDLAGKTSMIPGFLINFTSKSTENLFNAAFEAYINNGFLRDKGSSTPALLFATIALLYKLDSENECSNECWLAIHQPSSSFACLRKTYLKAVQNITLAERFCDYEFLLRYAIFLKKIP